MKTRGTNPATMTDAELRATIRDAALEVYDAALPLDAKSYDIHFAAGTLQRLTHELRRRDTNRVTASEEPVIMDA